MHQRPIILTGFMCSGKTTLAMALGQHLRDKAIDLDDAISKAEGKTPRQIIEHDGEERFRELETRYLGELLREGAASVIALGGGAWILERNQKLIEDTEGICIWLDAPFELCWERIGDVTQRPLARDKAVAQALYDQRKPHYANAHIRIEVTKDKKIEDLVDEIMNAVSRMT